MTDENDALPVIDRSEAIMAAVHHEMDRQKLRHEASEGYFPDDDRRLIIHCNDGTAFTVRAGAFGDDLALSAAQCVAARAIPVG